MPNHIVNVIELYKRGQQLQKLFLFPNWQVNYFQNQSVKVYKSGMIYIDFILQYKNLNQNRGFRFLLNIKINFDVANNSFVLNHFKLLKQIFKFVLRFYFLYLKRKFHFRVLFWCNECFLAFNMINCSVLHFYHQHNTTRKLSVQTAFIAIKSLLNFDTLLWVLNNSAGKNSDLCKKISYLLIFQFFFSHVPYFDPQSVCLFIRCFHESQRFWKISALIFECETSKILVTYKLGWSHDFRHLLEKMIEFILKASIWINLNSLSVFVLSVLRWNLLRQNYHFILEKFWIGLSASIVNLFCLRC